MSNENYPQSNRNELYINIGNFGTIDLEDLVEQAADHFGTLEFSDLRVSPERIKTSGCTCCYDSNDWDIFLCVTLRK